MIYHTVCFPVPCWNFQAWLLSSWILEIQLFHCLYLITPISKISVDLFLLSVVSVGSQLCCLVSLCTLSYCVMYNVCRKLFIEIIWGLGLEYHFWDLETRFTSLFPCGNWSDGEETSLKSHKVAEPNLDPQPSAL